MNKSRFCFMTVLLLALSLVLGACGDAPQPAPDRESEEEQALAATVAPLPTDEPQASQEPLPTEDILPTKEPQASQEPLPTQEPAQEERAAEGKLVIWAPEAIAPALEEIASSFTNEYQVVVTVQQVAFSDIREKFKSAAPAGEGPDIIIGAHEWLGELVINRLVTPLDLGNKEADFIELALSAFTYNATLYGMPTQTENVALVRNSSLVPDAPESWDDVMATCEALAHSIELCFALQQGDPYHFYGIQTSFGGAVFGRDSAGSYDPTQVEIDSKGSIAAASFMKDMIDAGYIQAETDDESSNALFDQGQAAFMITGAWAIGSLNEAGVPYALSAIPEGSQAAAPFLDVQGFMVSAFSEEPLLAQIFLIEYVASQEIMAQIVSADPRPSAFSEVRERQADDEALQGFIAAGENGQPMAAIPEMSAVWSAWADALTLIQLGQEEPDVAFQNAASQIRTTISGEEAQATPEEEPEEEAAEEEAAEEEAAEEEQEESSDEEAMVAGGLVIWAHQAIASPLQEIAASFTDEFELPVTVQQVAFGEILDKFQLATAAGEGPDIIIGAHDWLGELVINGLLSPIDLADKDAEFFDLALSAFTYDATLYGMPTQTENVAFMRNSLLVPDAPESWDDVMATCEALADRIELCFALQQGDPYHFYGIQTSFGGSVFGRDSAGSYDPTQVEIDSEGSIAAASFMKDMIDAGYIQAEMDNDISNALFDEGQAAFMITGPWAIGSPGEAAVPYALSAIPEGSQAAGPFLAVQGFMVSAFSEYPLLAQLFLTEYVASQEIMTQIVSADPRPSAFSAVRDEQEDDEVLQGFIAAGENGQPMAAIPEMSAVWPAWADALTLIQQGQEEPDVAFQNAAEQIRSTIAEGQ